MNDPVLRTRSLRVLSIHLVVSVGGVARGRATRRSGLGRSLRVTNPKGLKWLGDRPHGNPGAEERRCSTRGQAEFREALEGPPPGGGGVKVVRR